MSHNTNIPAFRSTAFDTVAVNFWQDFVQGNPIGGGAAYESKLRELPLDGSLDSLKQLDRLLLAIKKDLQKRGYDEKIVLQQTSFRNLLLFIMFYTGRVLMRELGETGSWQPLAHMEQYYPNVAFGNSDNKFYHLAAFFPQSFLANTRIPPMFVLLSLGAKLFGSFERKFAEPLMGELAPESLYWAVAGYLHIVNSLKVPVGGFGEQPQSARLFDNAPKAPQLQQAQPNPQGIPSKIAQTAPKPINQNEQVQTIGEITAIRPTAPISSSEPNAKGQIRPTGQTLVRSGEPLRVADNTPINNPVANNPPTANTANQAQPAPPTRPTTQLHPALQARQEQASSQSVPLTNPNLPSQAVSPTPQTASTASETLVSDKLIAPHLPERTKPAPAPQMASDDLILSNLDKQASANPFDELSQTLLQIEPTEPAQAVSQPIQEPTPTTIAELTPHQLTQAKLEQESQKTAPKPNLSLHFHSDAPKNPAPPPAPHHKEHRFQAGGLAPMSLAPPVVTVQAARDGQKPNLPNEPVAPPVAKEPQSMAERLAQYDKEQQALAAIQGEPNVSPINETKPQPQPVAPKNTMAQQTAQKTTQSGTKPPASTPVQKSSKPANDNLFTEIYKDMATLPAANNRGESELLKAKAVVDRYDAMISERVAQGKGMISFSDEEMSNIKRAVEFIKKLANSGNTSAMIVYGICCFKGVAMPQDMEQGAIWIRKAADANDVRAQKFLSRLYYQGVGVEQSIRIGESWLEKAANNGHPEAKKVQSQFTHIKIMKDDYQVEVRKDKQYAILFIAFGVIVVLALMALKFMV